MSPGSYADLARFDARDMVRGQTRYTADLPVQDVLHAMMVPATIARGRVVRVDVSAALRVPGVVRVLTAEDFPAIPPPAPGQPPIPPALQPEIGHRGQPIALVVATTLEAAIQGAEAVAGAYESAPFAAVFAADQPRQREAKPHAAGDAQAALDSAAQVHEALYATPTQHHNPIELFATLAVYTGGRLTLYECTQATSLVQLVVAGTLQLDPATIDVKSPLIGGAFGQKAFPQVHTSLVARAAMLTGRPVKIVVPRGQIFHLAGYRPCSEHRVTLAVDARDHMTAAAYDALQENTPAGYFLPDAYHEAVPRLYGFDHYHGTGADVFVDRQAPWFMRGTHPLPSCYAFESAVDELAYARGCDPLAFRLANDATRDVLTGKPFSSRFMRDCLIEGARRFGWERRTPEPGSMRLSDGTQVGWGVACGLFPSTTYAANATLRITADGRTRIVVGGHEMGQGMRTAIANALVHGLAIDPRNLEIVIGDTTTGVQSTTVAQRGTVSAVPVAVRAMERMRASIDALRAGKVVPGNLHQQLARLKRPYVEVTATELAPGQTADALTPGFTGFGVAGPAYPDFTTMSHIAFFVEVHIEPRTRRLRVPRAVSVADIGRVISPRTALSQMRGGLVWGFSGALRERTDVDPRYAGYLNDDLADYVVAVNADIGELDVALLDKPDPVANAVGIKGMGEMVAVGVAPAIANAVYHATGKRVRSLPIRIEDLL